MPTKQIKKKFRNVKKNSKRKQKKNYSKNKRKMMNKRNKSRKKMRGGSATPGKILTYEDVDEINILFNEYLKGDKKHKMDKLHILTDILTDTEKALEAYTQGAASDLTKLKKGGESIQISIEDPSIKGNIQSEEYIIKLLKKIGFENNKKNTKIIITGKDKAYKLNKIRELFKLISMEYNPEIFQRAGEIQKIYISQTDKYYQWIDEGIISRWEEIKQVEDKENIKIRQQEKYGKSVDWNLGYILSAEPQEMEAKALTEWKVEVIPKISTK